jgi:Sel1 repeat
MAAPASSGTNQQITLDDPSFEKLLEAAWVLQCLHDQLHSPQVIDAETIASSLQAPKIAERASPYLPKVTQPVIRTSEVPTPVAEAARQPEVASVRPADHALHAEVVEAQQAFEKSALGLDAALRRVKSAEVELKTAPVRTAEIRKERVEQVAAAPVANMLPAVVEKPADLKPPVRREPAFNFPTAFNRVVAAFRRYQPSFRVNFSLEGLRAIAIATPVWLLALIAALLLLEAWRHQPFQSAQAISTPSPLTAEASINTSLPSTTSGTSASPEKTKKPESVELKPTTPTPSLATSHEQITDPGTSSVVQQLSRYEINGLRRQAKYGDDSAAFTLGMAYEIGRYLHQNCTEAARWVRTAAEAGNAAAQYNLGLRYQTGDGVAIDRPEAEKWLRKAAHRNREAKLALRMLASR